MGSVREVVIDDVMKVCRLCLGTEKLVWIFDNRIDVHQNLEDVVQIATGVTVSRSDRVSQKLCEKCLNITIRMFKFRSSSIANDLELKARSGMRKENIRMHQSIKNLSETYPRIILPSSIMECNMEPILRLDNRIVNKRIEDERQKKKKRRSSVYIDRTLIEDMDDLENQITSHIIPQLESEPKQNMSIVPEVVSTAQHIRDANEKAMKSHSIISPNVHSKVNDEINHKTDTNVGKNSEITCDSATSSETDQVKNVKRKISPTLWNKTKKKKTETENDDNSLVTLKYVTKSLFICDICNSILHSAKDLKKHKAQKHTRCKLCKTKFNSIEETQEHSENNCEIKLIMTNLPTVGIIRCDEINEFRLKYPSAFGISSPTESTDVIMNQKQDMSMKQNQDNVIGVDTKVKPFLPPSKSLNMTIYQEISLISDDEDESTAPVESINTGKNSQVPSDESPDKRELQTKLENIKKTDRTIIKKKSVIKPHIEIIGANVIEVDSDDNDITLLKNILKRTKKHKTDTGVQTDTPSNTDITTSSSKDRLFELLNARHYLNFYKIPVNISFSPNYTVKYSFESSHCAKKNHRHWSVLGAKGQSNLTSSRLDMQTKDVSASVVPSAVPQYSKEVIEKTSDNSQLLSITNSTSVNSSSISTSIPVNSIARSSQCPGSNQTEEILQSALTNMNPRTGNIAVTFPLNTTPEILQPAIGNMNLRPDNVTTTSAVTSSRPLHSSTFENIDLTTDNSDIISTVNSTIEIPQPSLIRNSRSEANFALTNPAKGVERILQTTTVGNTNQRTGNEFVMSSAVNATAELRSTLRNTRIVRADKITNSPQQIAQNIGTNGIVPLAFTLSKGPPAVLNGIVSHGQLDPSISTASFLILKGNPSNSVNVLTANNINSNTVIQSNMSNAHSIMPPPSNNFVPHRTVKSVTNPQQNQLQNIPQVSNDNYTAKPSGSANVPVTTSSTFTPLLRVRNLNELK